MKKKLLAGCLTIFFVVGMVGAQAEALSITPESPCLVASGAENGVSKIYEEWAADFPALQAIGKDNEIYKQDVGEVNDEGAFAPYYSTVFFNTSAEPSGATITWGGGAFITGNPIYLLVKDGNHNPAWYGFDLSDCGWNGQEKLELTGFWEDEPGAISHISIYGNAAPIPEPATMFLMGTGFVGLAGLRLRKKKK